MKRLAVVLISLLAMTGCDVHVVEVDTMPPAPPVGLYTETGDGFIEIFWIANGDRDVAGYNIYAGPAYEGPYDLIGTTPVPYFNDVGARNGQLYYYAVTAFDACGNESALSMDVAYDIPRPEGYDVALGNYWYTQRACGYDFSGYAVVPYADEYLDMFFEIYDGVPYMVVPTDTDIQDMGPTGSLLDVREAPADGWSATGDVVLRAGHTYVVWTWDNHFAKFRVTSLAGHTVTFDWAYQLVEGSPLLKKAVAERGKIQYRDRGH